MRFPDVEVVLIAREDNLVADSFVARSCLFYRGLKFSSWLSLLTEASNFLVG